MSTSNASNPAQRVELTERQQDVVRLIASGLTNAEIAERLGVTLDGVKWHVREILGKFGVDSREDAVERWREQRSAARRVRAWGGALWANAAMRWVSVVGVAAATGVAGAAALTGVFPVNSDETPRSKAIVAVVTSDPAVAVDHTPVVFGDGWVVVDEVRQTGPDTVIRAHLEGSTTLRGPYWRPTATLTDASGSDATPSGGGWEDGPDARMEFRFAKTSGPVTFKVQGSAGLSLSEDDIAANIESQGMDEQEAATFRVRMADISAASGQAGATFDGQAPAMWTFTLP